MDIERKKRQMMKNTVNACVSATGQRRNHLLLQGSKEAKTKGVL